MLFFILSKAFPLLMRLLPLLILFVFLSCSQQNQDNNDTIFLELLSEKTNILFKNSLKETEAFNYFKYTSIYFGGGVATGDINNDGLVDLFFIGNQVENKLYLNKGDLKFKDITHSAKISGDDRWYTGVTMIDINN